MGRYTTIQKPEEKHDEILPVWRGVGFVMMVLLPIMAYAGSRLLLQQNDAKGWFEIPKEIIISCPGPNLVDFAPVSFISVHIPCPAPTLLAIILLTLAIWVVLFTIFQLITFIVFRLFGAPRYGPTDAPPITRKIRRRWKS
jgi:hypothetical protein